MGVVSVQVLRRTEIGIGNDYELDAMFRQHLFSALVINSALFTA